MNQPISATPEDGLDGHATVAKLAAPTPLLAEIYVYVGGEQTAKYSIEHGEYLMGRDAGCHIPIEADRISRHHARLTFSAYELVIEDLGSSNGVFIDGVQVQLPTRLYPDQELQIGSARLYVRLNDATTRHLSAAQWDADLGLAPVRQQLTGKKYKALTTIARGGMGVILQARDLRVRRNVAMKVMKSGGQFSRESVLRFIDEAQLTGQLEHPNIVPVYELAIDETGETFYTMKFVRGITLDEVLRGLRHGRKEMVEKYPLTSLLTIFQKVCDGVAFAHSKGVIHRDLKPDNIMIGSYGEVLVMDWGLAKQVTGGRPEARVETALEAKPRDPLRGFETMHGVVVGTPPYISPEQARGELDAIDTRSDVYVLGVILYAILALRPTVPGDTIDEVLAKIVAGDIPTPVSLNRTAKKRQPKGAPEEPPALPHCPGNRIPEGISAIVMKAIRLAPEERYQTVEELQADIVAYQGGFATKAEKASWWRQMLLFAGRHKREFLLLISFAVIVQVLLVGFILSLKRERDRAIASADEAEKNGQALKEAVSALRGTAPTFAQDAQQLLDDQKLDDALEKIEYALEQVPNEANYHVLRGDILQSLLRFSESSQSYEQALELNPKNKSAQLNLKLDRELLKEMGSDGQVTPPMMRKLHDSLMQQKRVGEALAVHTEGGRDSKTVFADLRAWLQKKGAPNAIQNKPDGTVFVDLSKVEPGRFGRGFDLRGLHQLPVSGINMDDTRISDLNALSGLKLTSLSLSHARIMDLSALIGMPLKYLSLESTPVRNLAPLAKLPLETLRLQATQVEDLAPLRGLKLEQLNLAGCRGVKSIAALAGMPLEKLDLSRTGLSDLSPLKGSPVRELNLEECSALTDLTPLMEMKSLETVLIPVQCKDVAFLQAHPTLKRISYRKLTEPAAEFWAEYNQPPPEK
jgi:serine/threonine protein kinase